MNPNRAKTAPGARTRPPAGRRSPGTRQQWAALLLLATVLALPVAGCGPGRALHPAPYVAKQDFPDGQAITRFTSQDLLQEINRERIRHGLAPLLSDRQLGLLAQRHAGYMIRQNRLSHHGFEERFQLSGARRCVENVARKYVSPRAVVQGWLESPEHREGLLAPDVTHAGVALEQGYAVLLGCRR